MQKASGSGGVSTRRLAALLALLELAVAIYLEIERARGRSVACPIGGGGCETVQQSRYSKLAGVPLPILGLIGAGAMLVTTLLRDPRARTVASCSPSPARSSRSTSRGCRPSRSTPTARGASRAR